MIKTESAMRNEGIGRLLWRFSVPAIAGLLVTTLYNLVDRVFVGRGVGTEALAAVTVAFPIMMSIAMLAFMPVIGISQGAQPLIGYNFGARQFGRVREALKKSVLAATLVVLMGYLAMRFWPVANVGLFTKDAALRSLASHAILVFFSFMPIMAFQVICSNYFQAVGKPLKATLLGLSRQLLIFMPLLLILPMFWGIEGVWRTAPIADVLSAIVTGIFIYLEMKHLPVSGPIPLDLA